MLKDDILMDNPIDQKCWACSKFGHNITNCPLMHLIKPKNIVIYKYLDSKLQDRKSHDRKRKKKFNALLQNAVIKKKLKTYRFKKMSKAIESGERNLDIEDYNQSAANTSKKDNLLKFELLPSSGDESSSM